jgi:ribosomal protein L7/L12
VSSGVSAAKEEVKVVEEVKAERLTWDLELSSIDSTKKLSIIKEVRGLTGLGLKEVFIK